MKTNLVTLLILANLIIAAFGLLFCFGAAADTEPNDVYAEAETISAEVEVSGELNDTDRDDYYRVNIAAGKKVSISFTPDSLDTMRLWFGDIEDNKIFELDSTNSIEKNSETHFEIGRETADYIIRVYMYWVSDTAGTYRFEVNLEDQDDAGSGSDVGETIAASHLISTDTKYSGLIMDYDRVDVYKMSIPQGKKITFHFTSNATENDMHMYWLDNVGDELLSLSGKNSVEVTKEHHLSYEDTEETYYLQIDLYWISDIGSTYSFHIDLTDQDDAGSGMDAPAEKKDAFEILTERDYSGLKMDWDKRDTYKIYIDKAVNLTFSLTADTDDDMRLEFLDIEGEHLTEITSKNSIENQIDHTISAGDRFGFFYVSIYQHWNSDIGGTYSFRVDSDVTLEGSSGYNPSADDDITGDDDEPGDLSVNTTINEVKINIKSDVALEVKELDGVKLEEYGKGSENEERLGKQKLKDLDIVFEINTRNASHEAKDIEIELDLSEKISDDVDPKNVKLYYLDEEKDQWVVIDDSSYDGDSGLLTAKVDHLTVFAAYAEEESKDENNAATPPVLIIVAFVVVAIIILLLVGSFFFFMKRRSTDKEDADDGESSDKTDVGEEDEKLNAEEGERNVEKPQPPPPPKDSTEEERDTPPPPPPA